MTCMRRVSVTIAMFLAWSLAATAAGPLQAVQAGPREVREAAVDDRAHDARRARALDRAADLVLLVGQGTHRRRPNVRRREAEADSGPTSHKVGCKYPEPGTSRAGLINETENSGLDASLIRSASRWGALSPMT